MISTITKEQEAMIPKYVEDYLAIGLSTTPCDRVKAEEAVKACYAYLKHAEPDFVWLDSPKAGARFAAQMAKADKDMTIDQIKAIEVTKEEISEQRLKASFGSFEAYWVSFYAFVAEQLPVQRDNLIDITKEIVRHCGVYWTFEGRVIMTEKPIAIHFNVDKKLHNPNGLALEYKDGSGVFAINGKAYPSLLDMVIQAEVDVKASETQKRA